MADSVDSLVVFSGHRRHVVRLTNRSDGTGETGVTKVDRSALTGLKNAAPQKIVVEKIQFAIEGMSVRLDWNDGTDDEIVTLVGQGELNWADVGGLVPPQAPGAADEGDILLTTLGHTAGDSYDITLHLVLKG